MKRDYYEILGVSKSATAEEIKRAYRKLAVRHHPDKEGGDETKFKEATEAYETLSDDKKRAVYDQFGHAGAQFGGDNPFGGAGGFDFSGFDFSGGGVDLGDILGQMMGGGFGGRGQRPVRGRDLEIALTLDFKEAVFGVEKTLPLELDDLCQTCSGSGAKPGTGTKTCQTCGGRGQVTRVQQTILGNIQQTTVCPDCDGKGQIPETKCEICHGSGVQHRRTELSLKIPAGIDNGATIRLAGQGAATPHSGVKGDLYVHIRVKPDRNFTRDGANIISGADIDMVEAALGTEIPVVTVDGEVKLKIPAGTQSGRVVRLSGKGVPRRSGRGDHLVQVTVHTPEKLTARQKELLEQFLAESGKKHFWER